METILYPKYVCRKYVFYNVDMNDINRDMEYDKFKYIVEHYCISEEQYKVIVDKYKEGIEDEEMVDKMVDILWVLYRNNNMKGRTIMKDRGDGYYNMVTYFEK